METIWLREDEDKVGFSANSPMCLLDLCFFSIFKLLYLMSSFLRNTWWLSRVHTGRPGSCSINAHPKQQLLGQPFADVLTPPSLLSFLVPSICAFLCYFFNLKLFCLFSYIFCFILNILKVLRRWPPRLFCVP